MSKIFAILLLAMLSSASLAIDRFEEKLKDDLMKGYLTYAAPTFPVNVTLGIDLTSLNQFDIVSGFGNMNLVFRTTWVDDRLKWEPRRYGGLEQIFFDTNKLVSPRIWTPDVLCTTCVKQALAQSTAIVMYTGQVIWGRYGNMQFLVPFSLSNFPFDD